MNHLKKQRVWKMESISGLSWCPRQIQGLKSIFMIKFHELAQRWQNSTTGIFYARIPGDHNNVAHSAIADEVFALVISDAIDDFKRSGAFEDLDTNYLLLYAKTKLGASIDRMAAILNGKELQFEDGDRDIFDISLPPKIFRWSKMPAFGYDTSAKIAARELHTYAYMLLRYFCQAIRIREDMPRGTMLNMMYDKDDVAAQTIDPKTYEVLKAMLYVASRPSPIY